MPFYSESGKEIVPSEPSHCSIDDKRYDQSTDDRTDGCIECGHKEEPWGSHSEEYSVQSNHRNGAACKYQKLGSSLLNWYLHCCYCSECDHSRLLSLYIVLE